MDRITVHHVKHIRGRLRADAEGELTYAPGWLRSVFVVLFALTVLEALDEFGWIGGPSVIYQRVIHDAVLAAAAVLILTRAIFEPVARRAWLAFGGATALWCAGTVSWSVVYGGQVTRPTRRSLMPCGSFGTR